MEERGLDSYGSPSEPVVGCCEDRNMGNFRSS